jgi:hypothetical protein
LFGLPVRPDPDQPGPTDEQLPVELAERMRKYLEARQAGQ